MPLVVRHSIDYLHKHGIKSNQIYRAEPDKIKLQQLRKLYTDRVTTFPYHWDVPVACGMLKAFISELPESILTRELHGQFEQTTAIAEPQRESAMRALHPDDCDCYGPRARHVPQPHPVFDYKSRRTKKYWDIKTRIKNVGIVGAADGEIVAEPEVQKAALNVLVNCVCAPVHRVSALNLIFIVPLTHSHMYNPILCTREQCYDQNSGGARSAEGGAQRSSQLSVRARTPMAEPEVQKAALNVLVNCVCAPVHRVSALNQIFIVPLTHSHMYNPILCTREQCYD
ncbi:hypothetical protein ACJJTC_013822 [Scirpophaga incertulas]